MDIEEPSGLDQTTINVAGKQVVITLSGARDIQQALNDYLLNNKEQLAQVIPSNLLDDPILMPGEAWISEDGIVRMGHWLLDVMDNQPVLFCGAAHAPRGSYRYVAMIECTEEGLWKIRDIQFQRLF